MTLLRKTANEKKPWLTSTLLGGAGRQLTCKWSYRIFRLTALGA